MAYNTQTGLNIAANELYGGLKEKVQLAAVYFTDVERSAVKATNRDLVAPKAKHVRLLIASTWEQTVNMNDIFKLLDNRTRDNNWIVAFKTLILIHTLMREGNGARVMGYLSTHPAVLNMSYFRDSSSGGAGMDQTRNIKSYAAYLEEKVVAFREMNEDYLRPDAEELILRMQTMLWKDGLHKEVSVLQNLLSALLQSKFFVDSVDNEVTLTALQLLVKDLMKLFQVINQGVINVLGEFFELSRDDALKGLALYSRFCELTPKINEYFDIARRVQNGLGITIPELKHAPTSLLATLKSYVDDPAFEQVRANHIASKTKPSQASNKSDARANDVFSSLSKKAEKSGSNRNLNEFAAPVKANQFAAPVKANQDFDFFGTLSDNNAVVVHQPQNQNQLSGMKKVDSFGFSEESVVANDNFFQSNAQNNQQGLSQISQVAQVNPFSNGQGNNFFSQSNNSFQQQFSAVSTNNAFNSNTISQSNNSSFHQQSSVVNMNNTFNPNIVSQSNNSSFHQQSSTVNMNNAFNANAVSNNESSRQMVPFGSNSNAAPSYPAPFQTSLSEPIFGPDVKTLQNQVSQLYQQGNRSFQTNSTNQQQPIFNSPQNFAGQPRTQNQNMSPFGNQQGNQFQQQTANPFSSSNTPNYFPTQNPQNNNFTMNTGMNTGNPMNTGFGNQNPYQNNGMRPNANPLNNPFH